MNKKRLVRTSTICLIISFIIITVISIQTINTVVDRENTSMATLIATNIYEDINTDLQGKIYIGRTMANDSGIIEVLMNEDKYTQEECETIFKEIMGNYVHNLDCDTAFVVSDKTRRYYTQMGFNKTVDTINDAHDVWYSDFLAEGKDYSFNIDNDETHENTWTVFINVKVYDSNGAFLGVCGIGTVIKDMQTVITDMQKQYEVKVSIIDRNRYIQMDTDDEKIDQKILDELKVNYLNSEINYTKVSDGYVVTKYMPEFEWTLVIQRHMDTTAIMLKLIAKNIMVMVGVIVLLLIGSTYFIEKDTEKLAEDFQLDNYSNLVAIYEAVYIIDIERDRGREIKSLFDSKFNLLRDKGAASEQLRAVTQNWVPKDFQKSILEFVDLNTLPARIHGKRSIAEEFKIIRLGNREEWSRAIFIPVGDPDKEVKQVLFALENIDEEKRKSEEMVQEIETAKAASEAKGRFLANMSHEIRTPINAVLGMNTMILRECDDPLVRKHAMNIHNAGNTLLSLVNDILDISKIESGKMEIVPVEYSLASLIVDVVNMVSFKAEAKGLALNCDVDETLPSMLLGDDVRIRQIILNLMNNAVKYTEEGEVTLSIKNLNIDKKEIAAKGFNGSVSEGENIAGEKNVELEISVKDTGVGIKPEDMEKLYADFERIEDSVTRKEEGTGLGMSITIKLLELMDSVLELDSTYGVGSTFSFKLVQKIVNSEPIGNMENQTYAMMDNYDYAPGFMAPDAHVLVVDDTDMNRMVFEGLLKPTGIKVSQADSGRAALECVWKEKYDVIFLDHMMPGMDGIEVVKQIKSDISHKNVDTPVIALTANAISGAREMYLEAGFDDYMTKPLVPEKLERMLETLIPEEKITHDIDSSHIRTNSAHSIDESRATNNGKATSKMSIEDLPTIEGLDWNYCMTHLSGSAVMSTVMAFYNSIDSWIDEIKNYYDSLEKQWSGNKELNTVSNIEADTDMEDILDKYRILVHSIKGAATIIGLLPVAGMAATLEYAARDKIIERVMHVTPHFSMLLKEYKGKMSVLDDSAKTDKLSIKEEDKQTIIEMLGFLVELVNEFDIHGADDLLERLKAYEFGAQGEQIMAKLSGAVTNIDNDAVEALCNEMIALIG